MIDEATHAAVEASAEHRAVIEQARGALMLAYGFDEDAVFSMLSWVGQLEHQGPRPGDRAQAIRSTLSNKKKKKKKKKKKTSPRIA